MERKGRGERPFLMKKLTVKMAVLWWDHSATDELT